MRQRQRLPGRAPSIAIGGRNFRKRKSASSSEAASASPRNTCARIRRQFAGEDRAFRHAVEHLVADALALRSACRRWPRASRPHARTMASRVARTAASAITSIVGADALRALDGARGQVTQDRLEPVVARVMQMVGLGRREEDAVDLRAKDRARTDWSGRCGRPSAHRSSAVSRSRTAAGPEFSAASASTSTICRSSRAK